MGFLQDNILMSNSCIYLLWQVITLMVASNLSLDLISRLYLSYNRLSVKECLVSQSRQSSVCRCFDVLVYQRFLQHYKFAFCPEQLQTESSSQTRHQPAFEYMKLHFLAKNFHFFLYSSDDIGICSFVRFTSWF